MGWYLGVFKKYVKFSGRARRTEYWMFFLFNFIFTIAASILDSIFRTGFSTGYGLFSLLYTLALFLPSLAVTVRRLHDTGKSGLWILFPAVLSIVTSVIFAAATYSALTRSFSSGVIVGTLIFGLGSLVFGIIFLVWLCTDSTYGDNKYGPNPKEEPYTPPTEPLTPPIQL